MSFYGLTLLYFMLAIRFLCLPHKAFFFFLILEIQPEGFCGTVLKYSC